MRTEINRLHRLQKSMQMGNSWHGKSLSEALASLNHIIAAKKISPGSYSIWELLLHIIAWRNFVIERLKGNEAFSLEINSAQDWPRVEIANERQWQQSLRMLVESGEELRRLLLEKTDEFLESGVAGKAYDQYTLLHGIVHHDAYHCGQIVLIRKILEETS